MQKPASQYRLVAFRWCLRFSLLCWFCMYTYSCNSPRDITVIRDVAFFDGQQYHERVHLVFSDSVITDIIHQGRPPAAVHVIGGRGKTVLPPLLNAHVHIWRPEHLKEAADAGVLAVFDMLNSDERAAILRQYNDSPSYAGFYSSGAGATVPGGHGTQFGPAPVIDDTLSPSGFVSERVRNGADYIKILREPNMNTLTFQQTEEVIKAAHSHRKLAVAHATRLAELMTLARQHVDGFVHHWIDASASREQLDSLKNSGVFIVPTLYVIQEGLKQYADAGRFKSFLSLRQVLQEVQKAHAAGIPILAGTDAPNFDFNFGTDFYMELELLSRCGLSNTEVLKAATSNIAAAFGMPWLSALEAGGPASFLLIEGNPVKHLDDISQIEGIWQKGKRIK